MADGGFRSRFIPYVGGLSGVSAPPPPVTVEQPSGGWFFRRLPEEKEDDKPAPSVQPGAEDVVVPLPPLPEKPPRQFAKPAELPSLDIESIKRAAVDASLEEIARLDAEERARKAKRRRKAAMLLLLS
jgi:hypothetical protein